MVTQTFFLSISIYLPTVLFIPGQQNSTSVEEAHSMNVRISGDFNTCSPPLKGFKFLCYMEGEGQWVRLVEKKQHTVAKHAPRFTMLFKPAGFWFFFVSENTQNVFMLSTFAHKLAVTCFFPGSTRQFRLLYVTPRGELWGSFSLGLSEHTSSNKYTSYICVRVCVCVCMADSKPTLWSEVTMRGS